jgi:hypothetical protein
VAGLNTTAWIPHKRPGGMPTIEGRKGLTP